jgi:hypothetical protein
MRKTVVIIIENEATGRLNVANEYEIGSDE